MPSGRVHSAAITAQLVAAGGILLATSDHERIAYAAGLVAGYLFGPDLDVDAGNISRHYLRRIPGVGRLVATAWAVLWWPYAVLVPHRSPVSHYPLIGTASRVGYVLFVVYLVARVAGVELPPLPDLRLVAYAAGGLVAADTGHWLLDQAGPD